MLRPEHGVTVQRTRISVLPGSETRAAVREIEDAGTVHMIKLGLVRRIRISVLPVSEPRAAVREKEASGTVQMLRPEPGATVQQIRISVAWLGAKGGCPRERG